MRTGGIKVTLELPLQFGKPDMNGVAYNKEAWERAVEKAQHTKNLPIVFIDKWNREVQIGTVDKIYLDSVKEEGALVVAGTIQTGGTHEEVEMISGKVTNAILYSIGISEK